MCKDIIFEKYENTGKTLQTLRYYKDFIMVFKILGEC